MSETKHEQAGMTIQVKHGGQVVIDPEQAEDQPAGITDPDSTTVETVSDAGETGDPPPQTADRPAKRRK